MAAAQREDPDLILLDLKLPAGGGLAVLENLRKSIHTKNIPVVVVTGSYLGSLQAGDQAQVSVRKSSKPFHLPPDAAGTPLIMFAAGTGLAPFRGFVQERATQLNYLNMGKIARGQPANPAYAGDADPVLADACATTAAAPRQAAAEAR